jgi:hypothetical protein
MKILGRILIILAVFSVFAGLMVAGVNLLRSIPAFDGPGEDRPAFVPNNGGDESSQQPMRPEREGDDDEDGGRQGPSFRGSRWIFGMAKNTGVMAVLVVLIVWPRSVAKKKKKQAGVKSAS